MSQDEIIEDFTGMVEVNGIKVNETCDLSQKTCKSSDVNEDLGNQVSPQVSQIEPEVSSHVNKPQEPASQGNVEEHSLMSTGQYFAQPQQPQQQLENTQQTQQPQISQQRFIQPQALQPLHPIQPLQHLQPHQLNMQPESQFLNKKNIIIFIIILVIAAGGYWWYSRSKIE